MGVNISTIASQSEYLNKQKKIKTQIMVTKCKIMHKSSIYSQLEAENSNYPSLYKLIFLFMY